MMIVLQYYILKIFIYFQIQNNYNLASTAKMNFSITPNAIQMMSQEKESEMIVQVINLKKMKAIGRIGCDLSDGIFKIRAFITDKTITEDDNNAFIKVTSYGLLSQDDRAMGVVVNTCQVLDYYSDRLGNPIDFLKERILSFKAKSPHIDKFKLRSNTRIISNKRQEEESKCQEQIEQKQFKSPKQKVMKTPSKDVRLEQVRGEVDNCQKISDLYPDFPNWQIVVKLVKKSYRQFISKSGKGKQTKVLNLEFINSTGFKISGALFGDSAINFHDALKEDQVYQVSKGQIREDQYSQNKGKNCSRYTIMFNRQSQFKLCMNTDLVPQNVSCFQDLLSISENRRIGEDYDAVGIVVSISDEVQIPKDNRTLYKQTLEICDPKNELRMDCVIWNKSIQVDQRLLYKTVGLFGFRLNQFNERLSLNSSFKSELKILDNHQYNKYEAKKLEKNKMEPLSERKDRNGTVEIEQNLKNLKQLESEVAYIEEGKQIKSTLTLTLTFITNKSWSYESCPFCRKSAESGNRCPNCDKYVEQTIPRFKLNVELSDYCGSIWATGFQQFGARIFADYSEGIKGIKQLQELDRQRLFEKYQFQELTVKIISKLDRDHQVKHTVNRVSDSNLVRKTEENIKRITNIK